MSEKSPQRIRLFSYTSSGTRFLTKALADVDLLLYRQGPSHAPLPLLMASHRLETQDKTVVVYGDPRYSLLSLMAKRGPVSSNSCRACRAMAHLGVAPELIEILHDHPFLSGQSPSCSREHCEVTAATAWSQFDGIQYMFNSWLAAENSPCDICFIKYESLRERSVVKKLASFLENDKIEESLYNYLNKHWKPRATSLKRLDASRLEFLNNHFKDLLDIQSSLPAVYILEKNNG